MHGAKVCPKSWARSNPRDLKAHTEQGFVRLRWKETVLGIGHSEAKPPRGQTISFHMLTLHFPQHSHILHPKLLSKVPKSSTTTSPQSPSHPAHDTSGLEQLPENISLVSAEQDKSPPLTVWLLVPMGTQCTPGWLHLQTTPCFTKILDQNKIQSTKPSISLCLPAQSTWYWARPVAPPMQSQHIGKLLLILPFFQWFPGQSSLILQSHWVIISRPQCFFPCDLKPRKIKHVRENSCFQDWGTGKY